MFGDLQSDQIECAVESMLFVSDAPVTVLSLSQALECDATDVQRACEGIRDRLQSQNSGIQIREVAGGWQLCTNPSMHDLLEHYVLSWETHRLSQAALETLAIIAYTQPATRANVADVRGVNSDSSISSLIEKGYVREVGVQDSPGNPVLYGTTRTFLERFGMNSLKDLPDLEQHAPDQKTRDYIASRLSPARETADDALYDVSFDERETAHGDARDGDSESDVQSRLRHVATEAFAKASGVTDKIDFDELQFDEGDQQ